MKKTIWIYFLFFSLCAGKMEKEDTSIKKPFQKHLIYCAINGCGTLHRSIKLLTSHAAQDHKLAPNNVTIQCMQCKPLLHGCIAAKQHIQKNKSHTLKAIGYKK